jgi:pimeloyl-ACP methyl ester carboxylesterase
MSKRAACLLVCGVVLLAGCSPSAFLARELQIAPNRFPDWFAPSPKIWYSLPTGFATNFPRASAKVGPPDAELSFRWIEPAAYQLAMKDVHGSRDGVETRHFQFTANLRGPHAAKAHAGTMVLLHGFALDARVVAPWALHYAALGWRCALVDLRGHGKSTGPNITYGPLEAADLSQWLDGETAAGRITPPLVVFGESYGAAVALRWAASEPRINAVVAVSPYAELKPAMLAIRSGYASWVPKSWTERAADRLPRAVGVAQDGLDPVTWVRQVRQPLLLIGGDGDEVAPEAALRRLKAAAAGPVELAMFTKAIHETLPFLLDDVAPKADAWLAAIPPATPRPESDR